jgi:uncharacterized protein YkwD
MQPWTRLICTWTAALLVLGAGLAGASAAFAACPGADAHPDEISVADYASSLVCVINETRRDWGRPQLTVQRNLKRAAAWHASDMVTGRYFSHTSDDGETFADRLDRANFIPRTGGWRAGENLAAGRGRLGTPSAIASAWMKSKEHRVNMLDQGFTLVGIGVARGWPGAGDGNDTVTVDMDLGWRVSAQRSSG